MQRAQKEDKKIDLQAINQQVIKSDVNKMIKEDEEKGKTDSTEEAASEVGTAENKDKDSKLPAVLSSFIKTNNNLICDECGLAPCDAVTYEVALAITGAEANKRNNGHYSGTRHHLYKFYVASKYGSLGRSNRIQIPRCIEIMIHKMYPDPNGEYVGFRNSGAHLDVDSTLAKKKN